jgi:Ca-activated chloride channel family protein
MDFQYPFMLLLLLFVPVLIYLFRLAQKNNQEMRDHFGDWLVLQRLIPDFDPKKNPLKFRLLLSAFILLVIALANPRIGIKNQKIKSEGVDIYLALDISKSMWVKDITPVEMDRLDKARLLALKLVEELKGNKIGLIFFAGEAFLQMPLTLDFAAAGLFLNEGLGDFEIVQGTDISEVVNLALKTRTIGLEDGAKPKQAALVILSDGEDHDKKGLNAVQGAIKNGLYTFCIGVGGNGGTIPAMREGSKKNNANDPYNYTYEERNTEKEEEVTEFHKDKSGKIVISKSDKEWLKQMATAGNGRFFDVDEGAANIAQRLKKNLNKLEKSYYNDNNFDEYQSYYQWFVFFALILLGTEYLISYRKNTKEQSFSIWSFLKNK